MRPALAGAALLVLTARVFTQAQAQAPEARRSAAKDLKAPAAVGDATSSGYELALEGTTKDKVATASAAWSRFTAGGDTETYELKLSGPLDEGVEEVQLLSIEGLPRSATAKLTYQRMRWRAEPDNEAMQDLACVLIGKDPAECERKDFIDNGEPRIFDLRAAHRAAPPLRREQICRLAEASGAPCTEAGLATVSLHQGYLAMSGALESPTVFGVSGSLGRKGFDYLEPGTLRDLSSQHNSVLASVHYGRYSPRTGYLLARFTFKRAWTAAQSKPDEVCRPLGDTGALRCKVVAIGFPKSQSSPVATFEWRRFVTPTLAVNPILSRDFKKKVNSLDVPIYFLAGEKGLTGGVRFGWRSDTDGLTFSVFVGVRALGIIG